MSDPDQLLNVVRAEVHEILHGDKPDPAALAEAANGLDEWLTRGGFLPTDWSALR